jgi:hypothetical protein
MVKKLGERQPYKYAERKALTCSTTDQSIELDRLPDQIIITNRDSTNIAYIAFDEVSNTTSGFPILPEKTEKFYLQCRTIHAIASDGTPTIHVLALAYRDVRIRA